MHRPRLDTGSQPLHVSIGAGQPPRARAKSALCGLSCGYGGQWPASGLLSHRCALHLDGEHLTQAQVGATWRSVSGRDGRESAPDRSLSTPASEQVNRLSDDFARALLDAMGAITPWVIGLIRFSDLRLR